MASENQILNVTRYLAETFKKNIWLWVVPTLIIGFLGTTYAFIKSAKWEASQSLHVRDEIQGRENGRFNNNDERKIAQETIVGLARSRSVVSAALKQIGPPANFMALGSWPTASQVATTQDLISVSVPKGSEMGGTEVLMLNVVDKSIDRAIVLNTAILNHTIDKLQNLRNSKGKSVIAELQQKLAVTDSKLDAATKRLEEMEKKIGSDLGELRNLDRLGNGESNLRTALTQIKNDLRLAEKKTN